MSAAAHTEQTEHFPLFIELPQPVIEQREYKNGHIHFYVVDWRGKHRHVGYRDILSAYGHDGDSQGPRPSSALNADAEEVPNHRVSAYGEQIHEEKPRGNFHKSVRTMDPETRAAFFANFNRIDQTLLSDDYEQGRHRRRMGRVAAMIGGLAMLGRVPVGRHVSESEPAPVTEASRLKQEKKRDRLAAGILAGVITVGAVLWGLDRAADDDHHEVPTPGQHQVETAPGVTPGHNLIPRNQHHNQHRIHTTRHVAGFAVRSHVAQGAGFTQQLQNVAAHKGITLSPLESYRAYESLNSAAQGNFFTDDPAYRMANGDFGISHPGPAHWAPNVLTDFHHWLEDKGYLSS